MFVFTVIIPALLFMSLVLIHEMKTLQASERSRLAVRVKARR